MVFAYFLHAFHVPVRFIQFSVGFCICFAFFLHAFGWVQATSSLLTCQYDMLFVLIRGNVKIGVVGGSSYIECGNLIAGARERL